MKPNYFNPTTGTQAHFINTLSKISLPSSLPSMSQVPTANQSITGKQALKCNQVLKSHNAPPTSPETSASHAALPHSQLLDPNKHHTNSVHSPHSPPNHHPTQQRHYNPPSHHSTSYSSHHSPKVTATPKLTRKIAETQGNIAQQATMESIYSYALRGFRGIDLATAISEVLDPQVHIYPLILRNSTIYHEIRGLNIIHNVPIRFPEIRQNTPVVFRIIRALCLEQ